MVSDYQVYRFYLSLKVHFTRSEYNVFEKKRTQTCEATFLARRDCDSFGILGTKLKDHRDAILFFVSNFSIGNFGVLYEHVTAFNNYQQWQTYNQSFLYKFRKDHSEVINELDKKGGNFNETAFGLFLGKKINIQSMYVMDRYYNILDNLPQDLIQLTSSEILRVKKCRGFVKPPESVITFLGSH